MGIIVFGMPAALKSSTTSSSVSKSLTPEVDATLAQVLKDPELLKTMAAASFPTLPPSQKMVMGTLWAMFNTRGDTRINLADVEHVVRGIVVLDSAAVNGLWYMLNPERKSEVTVTDFIKNDYLSVAIPSMLKTVRADVDVKRQEDALEKAATKSNSVLDFGFSQDDGFINVFV